MATATTQEQADLTTLRTSEVRYRRLFEAARDGILMLDVATRQITDVNPFMEELLGYTRDEFLGKELWEIGLLKDEPASVAAFREIQENGTIRYENLPLQTRQGQRRDVEFISNVYAENGHHVIQCHIREITKHKRDELAAARLAAIVDSSADAIISKTLDGIITTWNAGAQNLFGYTAQEAIGRPVSFLAPAYLPDEMPQLLERIRRGERVQHYETERVHKDGSRINISLSISPVKDMAGRIIGASSIKRDITQRKRSEATLRASEERYRTTLDSVLEGCQLIGFDWCYLYLNNAAAIHNRRPNEELLGRKMTEVWPGIEASAVFALLRRCMAERIALREEIEFVFPDGNTSWFDVQSQPVPEGIFVLSIDITERKRAGDAVRQSEERMNALVQSIDEIVFEFDAQGTYINVWAADESLLAKPKAELLGHTVEAVLGAELARPFVAACQRVIATGQAESMEYSLEVATGRCWFLSRISPIVRVDGSHATVCMLARDITERKHAEEALQRAHDELEVRVAKRTVELEQANAALRTQIAEREEAEAETRTRARQQQAVAELGQRALTDIDMGALLTGATALVVATLDVEISSILELLPGGADLRICANTGLKADVSRYVVAGRENSQAGYALDHDTPMIVSDLRTETRFKPSVMLLEQGVVSGVTVIVGGYEQSFGTLAAHTVRPRRFSQDDVHFLQAMSNVLAAAIERNRIETEIRQLNVQLSATNDQLSIENVERQMALGALREATVVLQQSKEEAEQAREEAEAANLAKSEFLSRMSHELRTPMNAILGFGQVLEMRGLGPKDSQSVEHILKAGRHLLGLIDEVLDISRIEAGHISLSLERLPIADVVREALDLVRLLAAQHRIRLDADGALTSPTCVLADHQRLKQVLINLLSNAVKYNSQEGQVTVTCTEAAGRVHIRITDTGPGLTMEEMRKLFVPFERLSAGQTGIEGTGLGLVLSRRLVEAMAGTLTVASEPGRGSTFTVELPLAECPLPAIPADRERELPVMAPAAAFTILAIEDNASNYRLIEAILENRPAIQLLGAVQGSVGLDLARRHRPDLILLDLHLPDIMGWEVLRTLRESAVTQAIPVVVISADATARQIERLLRPPEGHQGANAYLTKPLNVQELLATVDAILHQQPVLEVA